MQTRHDIGTAFPLVVFKITYKRTVDAETGEEQSGIACILRRHKIDLRQDLDRPFGEIRHIADGGRYKIERTGNDGVFLPDGAVGCIF